MFQNKCLRMVRYGSVALFVIASVLGLSSQSLAEHQSVRIETQKGPTHVLTSAQGELVINISRKTARKLSRHGVVRYSNFGAKGDGQTDDLDAIVATHAYANGQNLRVEADEGFTYYIKSDRRTAIIETNTDFGNAAFVIDDTEVENIYASVFLVASKLKPFRPEGLTSLVRNQEKVNLTLPRASLITVTNADVRRYIRYGPNQNDGRPQTDIFLVDKTGHVDRAAPIIWDFETITEVTALPIDETRLTITGGRFTTIANQAESRYNYHSRNIEVRRSNVLVQGLEHRIVGEGDHGAPYRGFISIRDCSNVTVRNSVLTGHKKYRTIGAAGDTVSMGSYDISVNRALNVSFINCRQFNDIDDRDYWGIMASNFCKNILYDSCTFSRFDAHMGVANATIRNSTLGHMGINAIGNGVFIVENSTVRGRGFINLRGDYGSTWRGEMIIRDCAFIPGGGDTIQATLVRGRNNEQHDFGYVCRMPQRITFENLTIDDSKHPKIYEGPALFGDFNKDKKDKSYEVQFPYMITEEVVLKNVKVASGQALRISDNPYMFRNVKVRRE